MLNIPEIETDYLDFLIGLRNSSHLYANTRKNLYYRRLVICSFLVIFKAITLKQVIQIVSYKTEILARKDLSAYAKCGDIISESFKYSDRYATYSLTQKGLEWLTNQYPLLSKIPGSDFITPHILSYLYKKYQKDNPANHLVCVNQALLSILCASRVPLRLSLEKERPITLKGGQTSDIKTKSRDQIVPDLSLISSSAQLYIEADTMLVRFLAPKGPGEKIAKYALLYYELFDDFLSRNRTMHIIFSVQKGIVLEKNTSKFSEQELKVLRNPEKINNSVSIIRLIAELQNYSGNTSIRNISDILHYLLDAGPHLSSSLAHSQTLKNAALLLNILVKQGLGGLEYEGIRHGISILVDGLNEETAQQRNASAQTATERRKNELFHTINQSEYKLWSIHHGMSVSCCCSFALESTLPCLLPGLYFSSSEIRRTLIENGILTEKHICISQSQLHASPQPDGAGLPGYYFNNAYSFSCDCRNITICLENISDDIGGFLRAWAYAENNLHTDNFLLIGLIRDDYQLADGSFMTVSHYNRTAILKNDIVLVSYSMFLKGTQPKCF